MTGSIIGTQKVPCKDPETGRQTSLSEIDDNSSTSFDRAPPPWARQS